jgi:hypothetical protein
MPTAGYLRRFQMRIIYCAITLEKYAVTVYPVPL